MTWRLPFLLLMVAGCGGGGGAAVPQQAQPLALRVQALDDAVAGTAVPILVAVRRGSAPVPDYAGLLKFGCEDPRAWYPSTFPLTGADRGERVFAQGFVFPAGVHVLTVEADGIDEPAVLAIEVAGPAAGPAAPPRVPPAPGPGYMSRVEPPIAGDSFHDLAATDVDGDGDLDLLAAAPGATALWRNGGAGAFAKSPEVLPGSLGAAFADIDGDGDRDLALLVAAAGGGHESRIFVNAGDGTFAAGDRLGPASSIAFGDVDGDGDADLVESGASVVVRANDGSGYFGSVRTAAHVGLNKHRPVLGDIDGDGDLDLVAARTVWRNDGTGRFERTGQEFDRDVRGVALADMDGDGDLDIVLGNFYEENDLYLNDGTGAFARSGALATADYCTTDVAVLDIDEDGDLDIVEGNLSAPDFVWTNGGGTFTGTAMIFPGGENRFLTGDVDGNGLPDIVSSEYYPGRTVWYRND